jgi:hypothetical protein
VPIVSPATHARILAMKNILPSFIVAVLVGITSLSNAQDNQNEPIKAGEFTFSYAAPWIRQAVTSSMRAGQLTYKQADEKIKNVDVIFFHFGPGGAGGIQANIDRWAAQFVGEAETKTEEKTVNDRKIIYFTGKGTYQESMGGPFAGQSTPREGYTVLAAILPSEGGPVFLKMAGPNESIAAAKDAFTALAEGALTAK